MPAAAAAAAADSSLLLPWTIATVHTIAAASVSAAAAAAAATSVSVARSMLVCFCTCAKSSKTLLGLLWTYRGGHNNTVYYTYACINLLFSRHI